MKTLVSLISTTCNNKIRQLCRTFRIYLKIQYKYIWNFKIHTLWKRIFTTYVQYRPTWEYSCKACAHHKHGLCTMFIMHQWKPRYSKTQRH